MTQIICTLAGAGFRPAADKDHFKAEAKIGSPLTLEPDPENEYDENAVKVLFENRFIGFIPRDSNTVISRRLLAGDELTAEIIAFEAPLKPVMEITL